MYLFDIIEYLADFLGQHVQIEGTATEDAIFLYQLRPYELPQRNFSGLSEVSAESIIYRNNENSMGFQKFVGDLIVSNEVIDIGPENILLYLGDVNPFDMGCFSNCTQLILPYPNLSRVIEDDSNSGRTETLYCFMATHHIIFCDNYNLLLHGCRQIVF